MTILYTVIHFFFTPRRKETTCYHVQVQHGDPFSPHKALYLRFSFMLQFVFLPQGGVGAHTQAHSHPPVMLSEALGDDACIQRRSGVLF